MSLSAYAPAPALLTSLSRAGWGDLAGREWQGVRSTLRALVDQLPHKSASGWTTADQVAVSTGLSSRWTRHCMQLLEDLGVIEWTRGGVVDGRPAPSYVRIVKTVLIDLIRAARPVKEAAERARRAATAARIAHLRNVRGVRSRRSRHAELSGSPSTPSGEVSTSNLPERSNTMRVYVPPICQHDNDARRMKNGQSRCPICRRAEHAKTTAVKPTPVRRQPDLLDYAALAAGERAEDDE